MGAVISNYLYQYYDFGALDDGLRNPLSAFEHSASDITSGHGSLVDYATVGGGGYAGYSAGRYALGGSAAAEGVVTTEAIETTGILAEVGEAALGIAETIGPLAILI